MKSEKMVTRTIKTSVCKVLSIQVSTETAFTQTLKISGTFDDSKELLKAIKAKYETDDYKPVAITEVEVNETLYGLPESKFIEIATVLPDRKKYGVD